MRVRHLAALTLAVAICALVGSTSAISRQAGPPPPPTCDAGTTQVDVQDFTFVPQTLTVAQGTTVCWTNTGQSPHTVTSSTGLFDSGTMMPGDIFSFTFDTPGTFDYICIPHESIGMVGSITVTGGPPPPPAPPPGQLVATVGTNDATNISLTMNGTRVMHLAAGTYQIEVHDNSTFHDFHLTGPGVDMKTEVDTRSVVTWTVTFTDGVYTFVCDPHVSTMNGHFRVS